MKRRNFLKGFGVILGSSIVPLSTPQAKGLMGSTPRAKPPRYNTVVLNGHERLTARFKSEDISGSIIATTQDHKMRTPFVASASWGEVQYTIGSKIHSHAKNTSGFNPSTLEISFESVDRCIHLLASNHQDTDVQVTYIVNDAGNEGVILRAVNEYITLK